MKITRRMFVRTVLIVLAIAALTQTAASQTRDERAVRAASDAWQRYIVAQNVDSIVALHTSDAIIMFSHAPLVRGTTAIRDVYTNMVKIPGLALHWTPTKIEVGGPAMATEYGTYAESYDTPQGKASDGGNYVVIWRKVDGKWRVALDAPNTTDPLPSAPSATPPMDPSTMETHSASALTWSDLTPPGFPTGAKVAVLHGDPGGPGGFVLRLQFPDGYQIPVHWHPTGENVTVVSGSLSLGAGNSFDASALRTYGPGDFAYLPPRQAHFGQAHGATIVQINGRGPFAINAGAPK